MSSIRESDLPGIGRKFQIEAQAATSLSLWFMMMGRRELYHFDPNGPDELLMVTISEYGSATSRHISAA
jgi:TrkA domain protein